MKHFTEQEFECKCGQQCGYGLQDIDVKAVELLLKARELAGVPFTLTSAVRCPTHILAIKKPTSSHNADKRKGKLSCAFDIATPTSEHVFKVVKALMDVGFTRLGWNQGTNFIHTDFDKTKPQNLFFKY